jgi:LemA protein
MPSGLGGLGGLVVLVLIVLVIVGLVGLYNKLVRLRNRYKNAFSQIDVQLKRRHDLIPNLVETAKGYLRHERETLEAVIAARNRAVQAREQASDRPGEPDAMQELRRAEGELSGTLGRLFALSESYPDLKANQTMERLMEELTSTENRIAFARQAFNDAVTQYNTGRETFPAVLIARNFGFQEAELFEIDEPEQREAPSVSFS